MKITKDQAVALANDAGVCVGARCIAEADELQRLCQLAIDVALAAQPVAVPDGFVPVPVTSTSAMDIAGVEFAEGCSLAISRGFVEDLWSAILAATPKPEQLCLTCNGHGLIGGHSGQTPDSYEEHSEPCPDCTKPDQQEAPELTDEEMIKMINAMAWRGERVLCICRAIIATDRAKRATQPADDPAAAWRNEGFNEWRQARASRTTED